MPTNICKTKQAMFDTTTTTQVYLNLKRMTFKHIKGSRKQMFKCHHLRDKCFPPFARPVKRCLQPHWI
ncbi:hypothetical protein Hanom_Chr17g01546421 [Helianthus anomalus]